MAKYIVKIERTEKQVRLTIPKNLAVESGLKGRNYCQMILTENGTIEVSKIEFIRDET